MQQINTEGETRLGQKGDPLGNIKKFKFVYTNKWYMHNPAPVRENDTHKLLLEFNMQTDHLTPARRPDLIITKKSGGCKIVDFAVRINLKEC